MIIPNIKSNKTQVKIRFLSILETIQVHFKAKNLEYLVQYLIILHILNIFLNTFLCNSWFGLNEIPARY